MALNELLLFGTDGIRGEVGKFPLTIQAVYCIGRTAAIWLKQQYSGQDLPFKIVIGKDTRASGLDLEQTLIKGMNKEGVGAVQLGVCPTPSVAYLTKALGAHLGLAVSASHNPGSDNGIKFFDANGYKLFDSAERALEQIFFALDSDQQPELVQEQGCQDPDTFQNFIPLYVDFAKKSLNGFNLSGLKIVIDCAFGSFSTIAPRIFSELGAELLVMNNQPDGENINADCGTLHPEKLSQKVLESGSDIGIAFDGDGDRIIVIDEQGTIIDGDRMLEILALYLIGQKKLSKETVVATQMSNIGLELYFKNKGIRLLRTNVGDKYVLAEMFKSKANLGGEQSGHIIFLDRTTTGDGLIIALELLKVLLEKKVGLSQLCQDLERFPQTLLNIKVKEKRPFSEIPNLTETIERCNIELGETGRLLIRYSGTENLARVMVEGRGDDLINQIANTIATVIEDAIGENC